MKLLRSLIDFFSQPAMKDDQRVTIISPGDPASAFKKDQGIIADLEFTASLQLRTPLRVLMLDGTKHTDKLKPLPDLQIEAWHGAWVPNAKSWRELGLDIDEPEEGSSASEIGYINRKTYLPFLIALRTQFESEGSIDERIERLRTELQKQKWAEFVTRYQGVDVLINSFFPLFIDTLPGVSTAVKDQLRSMGIKTAEQLSIAGLDVLMTIKGIGKVKASSLKQYADGITNNRGNERLAQTD